MKCCLFNIKHFDQYALFFLFFAVNFTTQIEVHPFIITQTKNNTDTNLIKYIILYSIYDITRLSGSFIWDIISLIIGIPLSIGISVIAMFITNIFLLLFINKSITILIITRAFNGMVNNIHYYNLISVNDILAFSIRSGTIIKMSTYSNHIISSILYCCILLLNRHIDRMNILIITAVSSICLFTFVFYLFKAKCDIFNKTNRTNYFRNNNISNNNKYNLSNIDANDYQHNVANSDTNKNRQTHLNSLYNSKEKLRNPNTTDNIQSLNININKSKSFDSATCKNFKNLNSESLENSAVNNNTSHNNLSKNINTTNTTNHINNSNIMNSNNKRYTPKNNAYLINNPHFANFKYSFVKNKKIKTINSVNTSSLMKKDKLQRTQKQETKLTINDKTCMKNLPTYNNTNNDNNNNKGLFIIMFYSLLLFNHNFAILLMLTQYSINDFIYLYIALFFVCQILFTPLNQSLINYSIKSNTINTIIFILAFIASIFTTILFNMLFFNKIKLVAELHRCFSIILILIRNEMFTFMLGYCNVKSFSNTLYNEKTMNQKKKISTLISHIFIILYGIIWTVYNNNSLVIYCLFYGIILSFITSAFVIGLFFL